MNEQSRPDNQKVEELVAMLDQLMGQGGGHVTVQVEDPQASPQVETGRSTDCAAGNQACAVPTLHKGIDDEDLQKED